VRLQIHLVFEVDIIWNQSSCILTMQVFMSRLLEACMIQGYSESENALTSVADAVPLMHAFHITLSHVPVSQVRFIYPFPVPPSRNLHLIVPSSMYVTLNRLLVQGTKLNYLLKTFLQVQGTNHFEPYTTDFFLLTPRKSVPLSSIQNFH